MTKELKPFNLEAAKNGDPICFANGRRIFFVGVTRDGEIAYEDERYPGEVCTSFAHNLRMLPKKIIRWVNFANGFYRVGNMGYDAWYYNTEDQAKSDAAKYCNTGWLAIAVPVEIEQ